MSSIPILCYTPFHLSCSCCTKLHFNQLLNTSGPPPPPNQSKEAQTNIAITLLSHCFILTLPDHSNMTTKASVTFRYKKLFTNPCKRILQVFKFKLKKPLFIRTLRFRTKHNTKTTTPSTKTNHFYSLRSIFCLPRKNRQMDRVMELKSFSDAGYQQKAPFPSPLTPAYVKMRRASQGVTGQNDVEEACRSFENYLVEMIAEEGKMRDLVDVEELLYCWKNLKSPVFINLVCRFYGELCKDLFSNNVDDDDEDDDEIHSLM